MGSRSTWNMFSVASLNRTSRLISSETLPRVSPRGCVQACETTQQLTSSLLHSLAILFRDVTELGNEYATTAYGASVKVPGNVDLLVAGTSCVDYSNLNNQKKGLEQKGESGNTFRGVSR